VSASHFNIYSGNAIHRPGALSLLKSDTALFPQDDGSSMLATGGLYAPTIRYHNSTFYVVCTNAIHRGDLSDGATSNDVLENFIVTTKDILANDWSDPMYFDFEGIDTSLFFDDDGKVYMHGSHAPGPWTTINLFEIDLETGKKLTDEKIIWRGTGGIYPEGPHIYKRKGWYYVMISEGGTHENHMITMARSQNIWGPYEECPNNPILTARGTDEYIRYTGHCEAFQDDKGQWFGVCLGVRKDGGGRAVMGRESFLTTANWDGDWLSFDVVKSNPKEFTPGVSISAVPDVDFLYIRDMNVEKYKIHDGGASITLTSSEVDLSHPEISPTFVGKRQRLLDGESSVTIPQISASEAATKLKVGIACYKDEHRYARIYYDTSDSAVVFEFINREKKISKEQRQPLNISDRLSLKIEYTEQSYELSYCAGQDAASDWKTLGKLDTLEMTGIDFVGPVIGVFAVADSGSVEVQLLDFNVD
jgi:beta-xylosidase